MSWDNADNIINSTDNIFVFAHIIYVVVIISGFDNLYLCELLF